MGELGLERWLNGTWQQLQHEKTVCGKSKKKKCASVGNYAERECDRRREKRLEWREQRMVEVLYVSGRGHVSIEICRNNCQQAAACRLPH